MTLRAKGTAIVAGVVTVVVLSGLGFYGERRDPVGKKGSCHCERWKECTIEEPNKCSCCTDVGGCRPPKEPN